MKVHLIAIIILLLTACQSNSSVEPVNSNRMESPIITNYLSNQKVSSFAECSQGQMWIGTFRGLNKYNVHEYHQYYCTDDSLDLPDNQINDIFRDSQGRLWIATVNGVCLYTDKDNFHHIPINHANKNILQILENKEGTLFFNMIHQLSVYNQATDEMQMIIDVFDPQHTFNQQCFVDQSNKLWAANPLSLRCYDSSTMFLEDSIPITNYPNYFYLQSNGMLWLTGNHQIALFDTRGRKLAPTPKAIQNHPLLLGANINYIHPYGTNSLLLNTERRGLFLYNYIDESVIHQDENGFPFEAPRFKISKMFTDSQKNLWIGSVDQGYTVRYSYKERFNTNNYLNSSFKNKSVVSVAVDKQNNLWIATLTDGLFVYNAETGRVEKIDMQKLFKQQSLDGTDISKIFVDGENNIWLASTLSKVLKCKYIGGDLVSESIHDIFYPMSLTQDSMGTIWVGTCSFTLFAMKRGEDEFSPVYPMSPMGTFIPGLLPFENGKLWMTAFLSTIKEIDCVTWEASDVPFNDEDWNNCIKRSVFIPTAIFKDSRNDIWIGTVSNGLMHYSHLSGKLETVEGIPCQDISSIEEDAMGNIWVGTQYGLSKYDCTVHKFTNYFAADGIGGNQFYDRSSCRMADGTLVFGGTHGLTFFNPIDVGTKRNIPLLFEDLKIHNRLARPQDGEHINQHLSFGPDIHLKYNENSFSISFTALDYCEHERVHYYYKMDNYDKYWIDARNNREAYYANLPAGTYTFKVKITNNDQSIVETENSIRIVIKPAPWNTWWAWCCYLLLACIILALFIRFRLRIKQERAAAQRAEMEKEQEQRVNKMNMNFFANVSHEFRTPLTMISGPVTQLCNNEDMADGDKHLLNIVQRSVSRMLRLVNQLMDFNKLEEDTLKLQVVRTDIIAQLQHVIDIFRVNASDKGITIQTLGLEDTFLMWLDVDKLDKIVGNLLSNAMKFTPRGGKIDISFDVEGQFVKIVIADSGAGIPEDQQERIFERYYQLNNQDEGTYNWGTGIGLYYARRLAILHHGSLKATHRQDGASGAVFILLISLDEQLYTPEERMALHEEQTVLFPLNKKLPTHDDLSVPDQQEKQTILVVDDDTEVSHYLATLLSPYYRVVARFDVDGAFKAACEESPDLILSDVVMPGKSGYELSRQVKEDLQLCHIPIILLTAKTTVDNQVEGLNSGADAYVTKPFEPNYLLALIRSQLTNREKVRNLLGQLTQTDAIEESILSPHDNAFMTELYQLMESELSNPELDVARMTQLLKISRTKFYYKVKGLTGTNPSVFFKTYKLNRASELMKEGKYTISEIADMTGFNTLSHFSTSFKKQFGVTPSDYGKG